MFRIFFIGCVEFSHTCLQTLITHFHAKKRLEIVGVATKEHSAFNADFCNLAPLCEAAQIPYIYASDINAPSTLEFIRACAPSVIYCFGWSALIKQELLDSYPIIGYHPAALPRNRGRHPLIWALALGLRRSASSFFLMDSGADSGDILSQVGFEILPEDNAGSLCRRVEGIAQEQICGFTDEILLRAERVSNSSLEAEHSALRSLNSSLGNHSHNAKAPLHCGARSSAPHSQGFSVAQSNTANTRIVKSEIQDSKANSESTTCHSERSEESTNHTSRDISNYRPQYDKRLESAPHTSLESKADSEPIPAERHALSAVESHSGDKQGLSPTLKASSGRGDCQGGRERLRNSSPSPLDEKEKEILKNDRILEVKSEDSERLESATDSESEIRVESAKVLDSEQRSLESENLESATDSESKNRASRDISPTAQYDNNLDSKKADCHANKSARNDDRLDSHSIDCHEAIASHNDNKTQSTPHASLESSQDSEKIASCTGLASARTTSHRASQDSHSTQESSHINITKTLHSTRATQHAAPARALDSNPPALESSPLDSRIVSNPRAGVSKPSQDPSLESALESPHSLAAQGFETKLLTGGGAAHDSLYAQILRSMATPQDHTLANLWRKRGARDGVIDFRMSARAIYNLVRALSKPYVGAEVIYNETHYKVWDAKIVEVGLPHIEFGKVLSVDSQGILIKAYDEAILLTQHEIEPLPKEGSYF